MGVSVGGAWAGPYKSGGGGGSRQSRRGHERAERLVRGAGRAAPRREPGETRPPGPLRPPASPQAAPTPPRSHLPPPVPSGGPGICVRGAGLSPPGTPHRPPVSLPVPSRSPGDCRGFGGPRSPSCPRGLIARISTRLGLGDPAGVWGQQSAPRDTPMSGTHRAYGTSQESHPAPSLSRPQKHRFWGDAAVAGAARPLWRFPLGFHQALALLPNIIVGFSCRRQRPGHRHGDKRRVGLAAPQSQPSAATPFPHRGGETGGDSALRSGCGGRRDPPKAAAKAEPPWRRLVAGARPAPQPELSRVTQL